MAAILLLEMKLLHNSTDKNNVQMLMGKVNHVFEFLAHKKIKLELVTTTNTAFYNTLLDWLSSRLSFLTSNEIASDPNSVYLFSIITKLSYDPTNPRTKNLFRILHNFLVGLESEHSHIFSLFTKFENIQSIPFEIAKETFLLLLDRTLENGQIEDARKTLDILYENLPIGCPEEITAYLLELLLLLKEDDSKSANDVLKSILLHKLTDLPQLLTALSFMSRFDKEAVFLVEVKNAIVKHGFLGHNIQFTYDNISTNTNFAFYFAQAWYFAGLNGTRFYETDCLVKVCLEVVLYNLKYLLN